jgi:hypothetical protein
MFSAQQLGSINNSLLTHPPTLLLNHAPLKHNQNLCNQLPTSLSNLKCRLPAATASRCLLLLPAWQLLLLLILRWLLRLLRRWLPLRTRLLLHQLPP